MKEINFEPGKNLLLTMGRCQGYFARRGILLDLRSKVKQISKF